MKRVDGTKYQCKFCDKRFKIESRFMSHRCKSMIRDEQIKTPIGQAAWSYYEKWMKVHRRAVPSIETFLTSNFYTTFVKFAQFAQKVGLPDVDTFIWYMREKDMPPALWTTDEVYASYIEFCDQKADPKKQAQQTIDYLFKLAEEFQVDVAEVFEYLEPNDLIMMLHRRQVSPWILLHSPKFKHFLINKTTDQEKITMQAIIRPEVWAKKKEDNPEIVAQMKKYVQELNL